MTVRLASLVVAAGLALAVTEAAAQANVIKFGVSRYTTHSQTTGVTGIGVPPGADAETGDATTLVVEYERMLNPNLGVELVLGIPPRIEARAAGSVAFLGDDILSAKNVSPTLMLTYHFGAPEAKWRPYLGAGINYTTFRGIRNRLGADVEMSDSWGWAAKAGLEYVLNRDWSVFASATALRVETDLVATSATVLQTHIDFRPIVYTVGAAYRF